MGVRCARAGSQSRGLDILSEPNRAGCAKPRAAMGTPQDARARKRQKVRRAKKNLEWQLKRAQENAEADKPKAPAKTAT